MKILALLDAFAGYDFRCDTSHLLLLEASRRGHEVYYSDIAGMFWKNGVQVKASRVEILTEPPFFKFQTIMPHALDHFNLILIRKDPPVDTSYLHALQMLSVHETRQVILNRPSALLSYNEKLIILNFPEWIPKNLVSSRVEEIRDFQASVGGKIVLKPLDGFAGKGIQLVENQNSIPSVEQTVMVQEFLPGIGRGEKRVFFLEDEVLGVLLKIPAPGNFLANPDLGATLKRTELTPREQQLVKELGPFFKKNGIFLAGVDLIDEKLTEINITSPGLLWELNEVYDAHFEKDIVDRLLSLVPSRLHLERQ